MRRPDGTALAPVPVQRYRCRDCGKTFSWLPPFLCRYLHYLAEVVQGAFKEYASDRWRSVAEIPSQADGPSFLTVWRWTRLIESLRLRGWLEAKLQAISLNWPESLLSRVRNVFPVPLDARPFAWKTLEMARTLCAGTANIPACVVQLGKLRLARRYSGSLVP